MIILGVILLVLGFVFSIPVLWTIGIIVLVIGWSCSCWVPWAGRSADGVITTDACTGSRVIWR